jgi:hypothetical protein
MDSTLLVVGFALVALLEVLLLRRVHTLPSDVRLGLAFDRHRRAEAEHAELDRTLRRRMRQLSHWVERHHVQLGTEVRAEVARIALQRAADAEKVAEATHLVNEVRELHDSARSIVIQLRTLAEQQRTVTPRVPERRPPPVPRSPSAPPSQGPASTPTRGEGDKPAVG